jgi:sterol desaturase/sphingolipid hydroxylase (fatty acid hydroxylase superfamily)
LALVYFHPFDISISLLEGIVVNVFLFGLDPRATALAGFAQAFMGIFQHWNVRTPHWLGYIIQRPEAHCRHHERDVHAYNYANIPLWDILFGTFYNPREVPSDLTGRTGFSPERRSRLLAMLATRDVHTDMPSFTHFEK